MPNDHASQLLMIAMPQEAALLLDAAAGKLQLQENAAGFQAYRRGRLLIGISGIGGHNMAAHCARLLARHPGIRSVANFGSAGAYQRAGLANGSLLGVSSVRKWDLRIPLPGYSGCFHPYELDTSVFQASGIGTVRCNSGCSFSSGQDRSAADFPDAELEDMELYALAALCHRLELPLWSMKFVSNQVTEDAVGEFQAGFSTHLSHATGHLQDLLSAWQ